MKLNNASYISLRTFRRSGAAVDTPVWFAADDASDDVIKHYVFSAANAGKVKRIRNSAKSEIASCDIRGGSVGTWQDCQAYLVDDAAEIERAYRCLYAKYGWRMWITDFLSRLSGRINQRAIIRLES